MTEAEIHESVWKQADDDLAWEKPVGVQRKKAPRFPFRPNGRRFWQNWIANKIMEEWLTRAVQERIGFG